MAGMVRGRKCIKEMSRIIVETFIWLWNSRNGSCQRIPQPLKHSNFCKYRFICWKRALSKKLKVCSTQYDVIGNISIKVSTNVAVVQGAHAPSGANLTWQCYTHSTDFKALDIKNKSRQAVIPRFQKPLRPGNVWQVWSPRKKTLNKLNDSGIVKGKLHCKSRDVKVSKTIIGCPLRKAVGETVSHQQELDAGKSAGEWMCCRWQSGQPGLFVVFGIQVFTLLALKTKNCKSTTLFTWLFLAALLVSPWKCLLCLIISWHYATYLFYKGPGIPRDLGFEFWIFNGKVVQYILNSSLPSFLPRSPSPLQPSNYTSFSLGNKHASTRKQRCNLGFKIYTKITKHTHRA